MKPTSRIPSLDGIRAISILLVIGGHLDHNHVGRGSTAAFAVHIFFVLSGYLITRLLQEEHDRVGRISIIAFYRRRCFRIFPAAFAFMIAAAWLTPGSRASLPYALTYTVSYHFDQTSMLLRHLWSLSVEEQFYLLWPLCLVFGYKHRARIAWAAMILAACFRVGLLLAPGSNTLAYVHFSFPCTMDSIAAGCLLAIYWPQLTTACHRLAGSTALVIALPVLCRVLFWALWANTKTLGCAFLTTLWGIFPLMIAFWILLLVERRDWVLNNNLAVGIGVLSYSLYLWQQPFTMTAGLSAMVSIPLLFAAAFLSFALIEKPMIHFGIWLGGRGRKEQGIGSLSGARLP